MRLHAKRRWKINTMLGSVGEMQRAAANYPCWHWNAFYQHFWAVIACTIGATSNYRNVIASNFKVLKRSSMLSRGLMRPLQTLWPHSSILKWHLLDAQIVKLGRFFNSRLISCVSSAHSKYHIKQNTHNANILQASLFFLGFVFCFGKKYHN